MCQPPVCYHSTHPNLTPSSLPRSEAYGVLSADGIALRGLFIIDREGVVQHSTINNLAFGRNVDEVLRTLQALQYVQEHPDEVCPAGWKPGEWREAGVGVGIRGAMGRMLKEGGRGAAVASVDGFNGTVRHRGAVYAGRSISCSCSLGGAFTGSSCIATSSLHLPQAPRP